MNAIVVYPHMSTNNPNVLKDNMLTVITARFWT